ncbi:hypothetical protein LAZ67_15001761 [Cordylochernes scorpioides]|uniref:Endonuclease n=1 Tax=Cordylochernes scorpioides TaxID=51811 RepID=A0ABY6LCJ2_9ARAC|nr:hypothetical protein LAZ67_15001761 [Cordylochernes scorpioides]
MLQHGIIAPSVSPYASPITLVTKRDKTKRFCIDYRKLNEIIAPDVHPLPLIETILDKLSKAKYYSSVDIASAYWQVEVEPNSRNLLAFVTLDKDHLQHLQQFLTVCQHENIKLNYNKCSFFKTNIDFLGYTVTAGTYAPQTRNLDTISAIKPPTNQKTLQSFLGAVNVYNKFIPDYARLRAPLNKLLKKDVKWNWDPDCQQAFTTLKESLTSKPVLHLYQVGLPCRLYCDASTQGIAGILKQVHPDGQVHPVQYFSRALRAHERNYTVSELECLAIVESVDKFRIYLTGIKFTIYTDHQALQWLKTIKNPRVTPAKSLKGPKRYLHVIVDHLTRYAWTFPSKSTSTLTYIQTLKTVLQQGSPKRLLSDRAPAFTSEKFRKFLITHGIQPLLTTSNNPQANGLIERLNATITGKLRLAYLENPKASWTQLVKRVTQTYNNTPHSVTSFPPTYLMFNVIPPDLRTHLDPYPEINIAREIANSRTQNKHKKDKEIFDKQHRTPHFELKNYRHPDTGKLAPYFTGPYKIIEIISPNVVRIDRPNQPLNRDIVLNPNIDIPKYDGTEDPRPWIESLEEIGFLYHWADYIISRYAAMNMIGSTKTWLNLHKISFTSWENFKSRLIEDFASDANKEEMKMRLNRMQQWNEPAIRFAEDILELCNKVDPQMEEETKINWVIGGIAPESANQSKSTINGIKKLDPKYKMNINVDRVGICEALIDTGADLSVVDLSTALNTGLEIINPDKMCSGPDGKELDIVGNIILNIKFDDKTITHQFVIMRTHLRIFILGRDFLKKMNAKIDCQREIIKYYLTGNRDVIKYQQKKIKSAKDAIIPELSIKLVNAFVEAEDGEYIIEENHKMFQTNGLRLARSLINVANKETYIWITNPYPRPLKILKNQTLCCGSQPAEINENLSYKEKEQLKQVLEKYADLFSSGLGRSNLAKHRIDTEGAKPIKHKPYRVSAKKREIIKEKIDEMLRDGIIRPSSSPWSFPVILVKKREGKYRFCVDYRKLNDVTVKDVYPIPRIDEVLDTLQGSKYFSAIDLELGYWQAEVEEKDKEKTAFTTAHGLYDSIDKSPIFGHFDPNAITYIHADASNIGLGVTLVQKFGDKEKVISYLNNYPFERIGIDFVGPLPSTKRRRRWIIVLTDYYTKCAETKAVSEATVKEVSTFLIEHIILRHGAPKFLISDRGSQFTSNLMKEVMKMCKVKHCFTTSYHPN